MRNQQQTYNSASSRSNHQTTPARVNVPHKVSFAAEPATSHLEFNPKQAPNAAGQRRFNKGKRFNVVSEEQPTTKKVQQKKPVAPAAPKVQASAPASPTPSPTNSLKVQLNAKQQHKARQLIAKVCHNDTLTIAKEQDLGIYFHIVREYFQSQSDSQEIRLEALGSAITTLCSVVNLLQLCGACTVARIKQKEKEVLYQIGQNDTHQKKTTHMKFTLKRTEKLDREIEQQAKASVASKSQAFKKVQQQQQTVFNSGSSAPSTNASSEEEEDCEFSVIQPHKKPVLALEKTKSVEISPSKNEHFQREIRTPPRVSQKTLSTKTFFEETSSNYNCSDLAPLPMFKQASVQSKKSVQTQGNKGAGYVPPHQWQKMRRYNVAVDAKSPTNSFKNPFTCPSTPNKKLVVNTSRMNSWTEKEVADCHSEDRIGSKHTASASGSDLNFSSDDNGPQGVISDAFSISGQSKNDESMISVTDIQTIQTLETILPSSAIRKTSRFDQFFGELVSNSIAC